MNIIENILKFFKVTEIMKKQNVLNLQNLKKVFGIKSVLIITLSLVMILSNFNLTYADSNFITFENSLTDSSYQWVDDRTLKITNVSKASGQSAYSITFNGSELECDISISMNQSTGYNKNYLFYLAGTTVIGTNLTGISNSGNYYCFYGSTSGSGHFVFNKSNGSILFMVPLDIGNYITLNFSNVYIDGISIDSVDMTGNGWLDEGLKVGNVIYFDIGQGNTYNINLISDFNSYSGFISGIWPYDNRRYGFSDSLPSAGNEENSTTFDESVGSSISWSEYGKPTITGRTNQGNATISGTAPNRYLWIVNPLYNSAYFDTPDDAKALNGNITKISGLAVDTVYYTYKLKQSATSLGLESYVPTSIGGTGTVLEDGSNNQTQTNSSGQSTETPYHQPAGGDNTPPSEVTISESINQLSQHISNFFDAIYSFLTIPVEAVNNLLSYGQNFMIEMTKIFSWIPNDMGQIIYAGMVIMFCIGVFKIFL